MKTREQIEKLIEERTRDRPELEAELGVMLIWYMDEAMIEALRWVLGDEDAQKLAKEDWPGEFKP